ncbi:hypothetical protein [Neisseria sp. S1]|uniref:hypothetical protein n=1 Tax=Neisseria sp. S1 TaxID=3318354 RepID=UPI003A895DD7
MKKIAVSLSVLALVGVAVAAPTIQVQTESAQPAVQSASAASPADVLNGQNLQTEASAADASGAASSVEAPAEGASVSAN